MSTTEIQTRPAETNDMLWSPEGFEHAQRIAKMFAASELIPQHLRGKVAEVTIALLMARRLNEDPLVVMQNMVSISGKAGWAAQYVIARANRSGVFKGRINWRVVGTGKDLAVTAFAKLADTEEEVCFTATMAMAEAEGWTKNPKYRSMPEVMLRYRSGAFLVRFYAPDVMLGNTTTDDDLYAMDPEPATAAPRKRAKTLDEALENVKAGPVVDAVAEVVTQPAAVEAEVVTVARTEPADDNGGEV